MFVTIAKSDGTTLEVNTDHVVMITRDPGRVVVHLKSGNELALTETEAAPLTQLFREKIARGE